MADVRYALRALTSIAALDDWLRPLNAAAADRVLGEIERTCRLIGVFPGIGRQVERTSLRLHITRHYRYRVIYRHAGDIVEIRIVLHPRQDAPMDP